MARNEEKQLARLNRFYLHQQKEEQLKKKPPRPKLETLHTTAEIQKWLPSIKEDIDVHIKQTEVTCYTEDKIEKLNRKISFLKYEYWAFVKKLRELNPELEETPWTDRPYARRKRKLEQGTPAGGEGGQGVEGTAGRGPAEPDSTQVECPTPIATPLLAGDANHRLLYGYQEVPQRSLRVSADTQNAPLQFRTGADSCERNVVSVSADPIPMKDDGKCDSAVQDAPLQFHTSSFLDRRVPSSPSSGIFEQDLSDLRKSSLHHCQMQNTGDNVERQAASSAQSIFAQSAESIGDEKNSDWKKCPCVDHGGVVRCGNCVACAVHSEVSVVEGGRGENHHCSSPTNLDSGLDSGTVDKNDRDKKMNTPACELSKRCETSLEFSGIQCSNVRTNKPLEETKTVSSHQCSTGNNPLQLPYSDSEDSDST